MNIIIIMGNEACKKIFVFIIVILFLTLTIFPVINSQSMNYFMPKAKSNNDNSICDLLILAPSKFKRSLQPLVCHKNKFGVRTKLVTLDYVYDDIWYGHDKAEKIKYFIKDAIEDSGIKYVLLVGGKIRQFNRWHLPVRYVQMGNHFEPHYISDMYYADIYDSEGNFSSWDSDGDGVYGEWLYGDQPEDRYIDLYPDIAVGRLPCRNRLEVKITVSRIIHYEKTAYNKSWFKDMVAFAGDTYPEYKNPKWVGYEGEYYADMIFENMTGFNPIKHYTSDGTLTHWRDITKALNKGCGFVYFAGHGSAMTWTNHFPNDKNRTKGFSIYQIPLLRNRDRLPVCVVGGCHNSQFDVSIFKIFNETAKKHGEYARECWSWMMTRKIGGGSIATIGCTALGFTKEDKVSFEGGVCELEVEFFKQYGQNNLEIIGDIWAAALSRYVDTYAVDWDAQLTNDSWIDVQVPQSWVLFGDPSLKIGGYPSLDD